MAGDSTCTCIQCTCRIEIYKDDEQHFIQLGKFPLHSGGMSELKFELDSFTESDWAAIAYFVSKRFKWSNVVGIPTGGMRLAKALQKYVTYTDEPLLIVDDVWTTGGSMIAMRKEYPNEDTIGIVAIARTPTEDWVYPFLQLSEGWE